MTATLELKFAGALPLLSLPASTPGADRIFGAQLSKDKTKFLYPGFFPQHEIVISDIKTSELNVIIPENVANHITQESSHKDLILDPNFQFITKPFDHQIESLKYCISRLRSALLLDCGLGKSKVAIDMLRYQKFIGKPCKTIVVCPKTVLFSWENEIAKHSGNELTTTVIDGTPKKKLELLNKDTDVYLITYSALAKKEFLKTVIDIIPYDTVILDESHNLQSPSSQKTKACLALCQKAARRVIMSGTVTFGSPIHLYGQLKFLGNFLIPEGDSWKFCNRFVNYGQKFNHKVIVGYKNTDVLEKRLSSVSVKYTKEVCLDLPERYIIDEPYQVSEEQKQEYNAFIEAPMQEVASRLNVSNDAAAAVRLIKLTQILSGFRIESNKDHKICDNCEFVNGCVENKILPYTNDCQKIKISPPDTIHKYPNPKLDRAENLLTSILSEPTSKVVVWYHYKLELESIEMMLHALGVQEIIINGSKDSRSIRTDIERFETDPGVRACVCQVGCSSGFTICRANYVIYYGVDFSLANYLQSIDRNYRIGQDRKVICYRLYAPGSVEELIFKALDSKEEIKNALMGKTEVSEMLRYIVRPKPL
jgi:non-specific serine/threonine protein kinase